MEIDLAVERGGQPRTMGHHQEAAASSCDEVARERQNVVRRRLVEIAGGLVGEQQQRLYRQCAADRDALLLSAGQLLRVALEQAAKAKPLHQLSMPGIIVTAGDPRLEHEVVQHTQARNQVELLEL